MRNITSVLSVLLLVAAAVIHSAVGDDAYLNSVRDPGWPKYRTTRLGSLDGATNDDDAQVTNNRAVLAGFAPDDVEHGYPKTVRQFRQASPRLLATVNRSNTFERIERISVIEAAGHSLVWRESEVNPDQQEIDVIFGNNVTFQEEYVLIGRTLYRDIDNYQEDLDCDASLAKCKIGLLPRVRGRTQVRGQLLVTPTAAGEFSIVARGVTADHTPKEYVWKLYSVPTLIVQEGRLFNITLDFVKLIKASSPSSHPSELIIEDKIAGVSVSVIPVASTPSWSTLTFYGLPGVGELPDRSVITIRLSNGACSLTCPQIKVLLVIDPEVSSRGRTSEFDVSVKIVPKSHVVPQQSNPTLSLSSARARLDVVGCIASMFACDVRELRALRFEENKDSSTKTVKAILPRPMSCENLERRAARAAVLDACAVTLKSYAIYPDNGCELFGTPFHPTTATVQNVSAYIDIHHHPVDPTLPQDHQSSTSSQKTSSTVRVDESQKSATATGGTGVAVDYTRSQATHNNSMAVSTSRPATVSLVTSSGSSDDVQSRQDDAQDGESTDHLPKSGTPPPPASNATRSPEPLPTPVAPAAPSTTSSTTVVRPSRKPKRPRTNSTSKWNLREAYESRETHFKIVGFAVLLAGIAAFAASLCCIRGSEEKRVRRTCY